jgi:hypothetical protein
MSVRWPRWLRFSETAKQLIETNALIRFVAALMGHSE